MKIKVIILSLLLPFIHEVYAKKVKFAVNMTGQIISPNGVHVAGDFQTVAGFSGGDFNAATTLMLQEIADTNIYSIVVDVPSHTKYEYRFVNGDQFYESEFIPEKSRVGYDFNDNRWIYIDSTANDTTFVGAILFGGNSPLGKYLLRVLVDVQSLMVVDNTLGIRFSNANSIPLSSAYARLYSFGNSIYENIYYVNNGTESYKFYNGIIPEIVPSGCATNSFRQTTVSSDTIISKVCIGSCDSCFATSINRFDFGTSGLNIFPNPAKGIAYIAFQNQIENGIVYIYNQNGSVVNTMIQNHQKVIELNCSEFANGLYEVVVISGNKSMARHKLIIAN